MEHKRSKRILVCATLCFILFAGCEMAEEESVKPGVVISLNDTIISPTFHQNVAISTGRYDLDVDNDKVTDLSLQTTFYSLGRTCNNYLSVMPVNNFEIAIQKSSAVKFSSYNTGGGYINNSSSWEIEIPAILSINDTIANYLFYTSDSIVLSSSYHDSFGPGSVDVTIDEWIGKDNSYIGFRNKQKKTFGWLKIAVTDYDEAVLKSYLFTRNEEALVVQE